MSKINGIYAASISVINKDLTLDIAKTIQHAETIIDQDTKKTVGPKVLGKIDLSTKEVKKKVYIKNKLMNIII